MLTKMTPHRNYVCGQYYSMNNLLDLISNFISFVGVTCDLMEYYLIQNLTNNYDINVRPVSDYKSTVNVYIGLSLSQIVDLVTYSNI